MAALALSYMYNRCPKTIHNKNLMHCAILSLCIRYMFLCDRTDSQVILRSVWNEGWFGLSFSRTLHVREDWVHFIIPTDMEEIAEMIAKRSGSRKTEQSSLETALRIPIVHHS